MPQLTIETINATLFRVKLRVKGESIYLRATLPAKDGSGQKKQYDLSTGLKTSQDGLRVARERAKRLESDLNLEKFKWSDWTDLPPEGGILVRDALKQFECWYWETRARTLGREEAFKNNYLRFLAELPADKPLTTEILRKTLVQYEADSFYRQRAHLALGFLARRFKITLPDDWKELKGRYKPKNKRYIPTDEEIEEIWKSISNPAWRWVFGAIAAYGFRPHELFHLDLSKMPIIRVLGTTKSGERLVYPVPGRWVEQFDLKTCLFPNFDTSGQLSNLSLGEKISIGFNQRNLGVVPYGLRDAYAVRCAVYGVDSSIAAKWLGHKIEVHCKYYQKYIDEIAMNRIWERLNLE